LKHLLRSLALIPVLLLIAALSPSPTLAADTRTGDTIIIASGDVINEDLYAAANRIIINGTVNGDVLAIAETITLTGKINGSITALGANISIGGDVTHAVRLAGDNIDISGKVGADVVVAGNNVVMAEAASVGRDVLFAARMVQISSLIEDSVKGAAETVLLNNGIGGDAEIQTTNLTVASSADISGSLRYVSENEANIRPGARIGGATTRTPPPADNWEFPYAGVWTGIVAYLMTLVTGIIIILLAPARAAAVVATIRREPWLTLGWGAIILFATPLALLIVAVTIIGIPLALIGAVAFGLAIYLSQIAVGLIIGHLILSHTTRIDSRLAMVGAFALGFTLLTLVKLIPFIGFFVWLATVLFGIGAMALSYRALRPPPMQVPAPAPVAVR